MQGLSPLDARGCGNPGGSGSDGRRDAPALVLPDQRKERQGSPAGPRRGARTPLRVRIGASTPGRIPSRPPHHCLYRPRDTPQTLRNRQIADPERPRALGPGGWTCRWRGRRGLRGRGGGGLVEARARRSGGVEVPSSRPASIGTGPRIGFSRAGVLSTGASRRKSRPRGPRRGEVTPLGRGFEGCPEAADAGHGRRRDVSAEFLRPPYGVASRVSFGASASRVPRGP